MLPLALWDLVRGRKRGGKSEKILLELSGADLVFVFSVFEIWPKLVLPFLGAILWPFIISTLTGDSLHCSLKQMIPL